MHGDTPCAAPPTDDLFARIRIAEAYPFARPRRSYLFDGGAARPVDGADLRRRTPVIACGANASPERLARKFASRSARIPVIRARLFGFAVVYAAHFSSYGALPATLHADAGAEAEVFVTWLAEPDLERMHASEGVGQRYDYVRLHSLDLRVEDVGQIEAAGAYLARNGALAVAGAAVRLGAVPARGSALDARMQPEMLRCAHACLAPHETYEAFMGALLASADHRASQSRRLPRLTTGVL